MQVMLTTPKEKAENLVDMFMNIEPNKLSDYSRIYHPTAKQCAILLVNELIYETMFEFPNIRQRYWFEVKDELEKL